MVFKTTKVRSTEDFNENMGSRYSDLSSVLCKRTPRLQFNLSVRQWQVDVLLCHSIINKLVDK